jgi:hypothetical protein
MLSFIKCFERVLIKIISDLFPDIYDDLPTNIVVMTQFAHSSNQGNQ